MAAASSHTEDQSLYAALGVGPTASEDDIRRAYRALATSLHPDKTQDPERRDDAAQLFTIIQEAYEVGDQGCATVHAGHCRVHLWMALMRMNLTDVAICYSDVAGTHQLPLCLPQSRRYYAFPLMPA